MNVYAIVENGVVTNTLEWDGQTAWAPPQGSTVVVVPAGAYVGIGSAFNGQSFTAPPAPVSQFV